MILAIVDYPQLIQSIEEASTSLESGARLTIAHSIEEAMRLDPREVTVILIGCLDVSTTAHWITAIRHIDALNGIPISALVPPDDKAKSFKVLQAGATEILTTPIDLLDFQLRIKNMGAIGLVSKDVARQIQVLENTAEERTAEMLMAVAEAASYRDTEPVEHTLRVGVISEMIALKLGIDDIAAQRIGRAAMLHDIGKLGVPDEIEQKTERLNADEVEIMKRHTLFGHEIAKKCDVPLMNLVGLISLTHHERFDGSGYPNQLSGEAIDIAGRIVAVADAFDSLTMEKPYRSAWTFEKTRSWLESQRSKQFCPQCTDALIEIWDDLIALKEAIV